MKTIDEEIRFHLSKNGWYVGETEIELGFDSIDGIDVEIASLGAGQLACYTNGKIFISRALAEYASLPQRRLALLHELGHARLKLRGASNHEKEYACDAWALKEMIKSGIYNLIELYDAIKLFGEVVEENESYTHPSSQSRYKRLYGILKEYV